MSSTGRTRACKWTHLAINERDERRQKLIQAESLQSLLSRHAQHVAQLGQGALLARQVAFGFQAIQQRPKTRVCTAQHPDGHGQLIEPSRICWNRPARQSAS
jgi:hypothetical protein